MRLNNKLTYIKPVSFCKYYPNYLAILYSYKICYISVAVQVRTAGNNTLAALEQFLYFCATGLICVKNIAVVVESNQSRIEIKRDKKSELYNNVFVLYHEVSPFLDINTNA